MNLKCFYQFGLRFLIKMIHFIILKTCLSKNVGHSHSDFKTNIIELFKTLHFVLW